MIVKNETTVLPRLFKSLHRYVDYYAIVDTGSNDGTLDLIKIEMEKYGIEGEVHHREWVNFGHNRQQTTDNRHLILQLLRKEQTGYFSLMQMKNSMYQTPTSIKTSNQA